MLSNFLTFSDGAKFAIIARNLVQNRQFSTDFSFWGENLFATSGIPYLVPNVLSIYFEIFKVGDVGVWYFSISFYFLLAFCAFLLSKALVNKTLGVLSALVVAFNLNIIDYATSGASETLFMAEIALAAYLISFKKKWSDALSFLVLIAMYFSRPQAFIFIAGLVLFWLINRFGFKKSFISFFALGLLAIVIDNFIIYPLSFVYPVTPILSRGLQSILTYSPDMAVSDGLRGAASSTLTYIDVSKKVFYNLYNFYKALPEIMNPYLFALFVIGMFNWDKNKLLNSFKISTLFMVLATFFVTAITIPFYRYIHPVVPLVYIVAVITLYQIIIHFMISFPIIKYRDLLTKAASIFLVLFFAVGQTVGVLLLDSRFEKRVKNVDKPPIYVPMSYKLKEITDPQMVIVTNLDTWGSWYGERKTIWFPLEPEMILEQIDKIDAIYLTSYKIDDENYYMGQKWREMFNNPKNQKVLSDFKFVGEYEFKPEDNYDKESGKSVLFVKNLSQPK